MPRASLRGPALLLFLVVTPAFARADGLDGAKIYAERCASCHGAKGEGSPEGYADPLLGDRPLKDLSRLIDETMPDGEPETLGAEESAAVAAYIYDAFYSPDAQLRNAPPRVELSRLTVRQYQNAVADLIGGFRGAMNWGDRRGLEAQYYKGRRKRRDNKVLERTDPTVNFDFGEGPPAPEGFEPHEFSIEWEGTVLAPETGEYEFVVRTEHSARLWVNDLETPLIDAYVKSGDDTEYRGTVTLLGGRAYPIQMEFSKAKQGVDDSDKEKEPPKPVKASVSLSWKRPGQPEEVIPERCLSPGRTAKALTVETPFPPDDRSAGYERGTAVSKEWDSATTFAAIEVANKVLADLEDLAGTRDEVGKLREFSRRFVELGFRRPLSDEMKQAYVDRQFEGTDPETAVKRVILLSLKSPRFLYRELPAAQPDGYDVASRLSFGMWDSIPDRPLLDAAANGQLQTPEQVRAQAERMVGDLRTRTKLRAFFHQWLQFERFTDLSKDPSVYPEFAPAVAADLRTSVELFLDDVVWTGDGDFRRLLLDEGVFLNGRLAKLYGVDLPPDAGFQKVTLDSGKRAGILTHPYLLTGFAYHSTTSPIHRGVFVSRSLLGRSLKPPPEAVTPLAPDLHPDLTTRERTILQTEATACNTCHSMINPLGFTLERYDAIGRFREQEKDKPIDDTGFYLTQSGEEVQFHGARELAAFLASSDESQSAFVEQLFNYFVKQPVGAYGPGRLADLRRSFAENGCDVRKLLVEIVTASALNTAVPKE